MRASTPKASNVVSAVYSEQDHGFRRRARSLLWHSTMLSGVISLAGVDMLKPSFSLCGDASAETEVDVVRKCGILSGGRCSVS
jgi:hypothetical protein